MELFRNSGTPSIFSYYRFYCSEFLVITLYNVLATIVCLSSIACTYVTVMSNQLIILTIAFNQLNVLFLFKHY
jgi:hypothetical protein